MEIAKAGSQDSDDWTDHFKACSNEFHTPKILLCPTDLTKCAGTNWDNLRGDLNVSYLVATSARQAKADVIVAGDRNVLGGGGGLDPSWSIFLGSSIDAAWDQKLHKDKGNLATGDGSARKTTVLMLRDQISADLATGTTNVVFSKPRGIL